MDDAPLEIVTLIGPLLVSVTSWAISSLIESEIEEVMEGMSKVKNFYIKGPFLVSETMNGNKRIYPKTIIEKDRAKIDADCRRINDDAWEDYNRAVKNSGSKILTKDKK